MDTTLSAVLRLGRGGPGLLRRLVGTERLRLSRRRLSELDDHILRDLGLSRDQARREAGRGSWDAPDHWMR